MQRISTDYEQCEPHDSYKEFTEKVPIPVKRRPRVWDKETVLNLTIDDRLVRRFERNQAFLKEYPDFRDALGKLEVGR